MLSTKLHSRLNHDGINLIREAMATAFSRGQHGQGLDPFEQTAVDRKILIEAIDKNGCEILNVPEVDQLEHECHLLLESLYFNKRVFPKSDLIGLIKHAKNHHRTDVINNRLTKLRGLAAIINGHDFCYSKIYDNHPLDDAVEEAFEKIRAIMKTDRSE